MNSYSHTQCIYTMARPNYLSLHSCDNSIILIAERPAGRADELADHNRRLIEVAPSRLNARQGDVRGRWDVDRSHRAGKRVRNTGVLDLPRGVDVIDHGM